MNIVCESPGVYKLQLTHCHDETAEPRDYRSLVLDNPEKVNAETNALYDAHSFHQSRVLCANCKEHNTTFITFTELIEKKDNENRREKCKECLRLRLQEDSDGYDAFIASKLPACRANPLATIHECASEYCSYSRKHFPGTRRAVEAIGVKYAKNADTIAVIAPGGFLTELQILSQVEARAINIVVYERDLDLWDVVFGDQKDKPGAIFYYDGTQPLIDIDDESKYTRRAYMTLNLLHMYNVLRYGKLIGKTFTIYRCASESFPPDNITPQVVMGLDLTDDFAPYTIPKFYHLALNYKCVGITLSPDYIHIFETLAPKQVSDETICQAILDERVKTHVINKTPSSLSIYWTLASVYRHELAQYVSKVIVGGIASGVALAYAIGWWARS
jgi:hypothetical protein